MVTYASLVKDGKKLLEECGVVVNTATLYMIELTNLYGINYYYDKDTEASEKFIEEYRNGIKRISKHEPMNYVLGFSWFYGYRFIVNKNVLIPRSETEELVANILMKIDDYFEDYSKINMCDIGTGSGAIAISLAKEEARVKMIACDISEDALTIAKENANNLEVDVEFLLGDMAQPLLDKKLKFDIVVCNPPYIKQDELLEESVKGYEPHVALFGGDDGLKFYRQVFEAAPKLLNKKSLMAFEIGYDQKEALENEVKKYFENAKYETLKDINGKDRMLFVYFNLD